MSNQTNDGGPAFPCGSYDPKTAAPQPPVIPGMTLRDWFAGQALVGTLAMCSGGRYTAGNANDTAQAAYLLADAMLAARKEKA